MCNPIVVAVRLLMRLVIIFSVMLFGGRENGGRSCTV